MMSLAAVQISELTAQFFLAAAGTLSFAILFEGVINDRILNVELDLLNLFAVDTF